jgi:hypothetical protein
MSCIQSQFYNNQEPTPQVLPAGVFVWENTPPPPPGNISRNHFREKYLKGENKKVENVNE